MIWYHLIDEANTVWNYTDKVCFLQIFGLKSYISYIDAAYVSNFIKV